MSGLQHDIEQGSAVFCISCSRLFRWYGPEDDTEEGQARCSDCAAQARLRDAVDYAVQHNELKEQRGTLSRLVALSVDEPGSPTRGHSSSMHASASAVSEEEQDAGVAALHDLIVFTRHENTELRKRLHIANHESTGDNDAAIAAAAASSREDSGAVVDLITLLEMIIPLQLRQTARYRPLAAALDELRSVWRDRERRLHALQAALLGAEATVVTLQEELLLVESSEVTLGSLVKMQQLEVSQMRVTHLETLGEVVVKEHAAHHAEARRAEAEALLRLRHDAEATLRTSHREMQKLLADAHTSLDQFVSQQQTRRALELDSRAKHFEEWRKEMRTLLGSGGAGGDRERRALVGNLEAVLDRSMAEHMSALAELDARRREADSVERDSFEKRIDSLQERVSGLEGARAHVDAQLDAVRQGTAMRQLELLRKQRDEAFHAREMAVDELRTRITHEGHKLGAMRSGFADASDQLKNALGQLPVSDDSLAAERAERATMRRRLENTGARLAAGAAARWQRRFLQAVWREWRDLLARSHAARATTKTKRLRASAKKKGLLLAEEATAGAKKWRVEAQRAAKRNSELEERLESARDREDAASTAASVAKAEEQSVSRRLEAAEAEAAAKGGEASLALEALDQARHLEALWYEQREALLDEAEALRHELDLLGQTENAKKGRWRVKADELTKQVDEQNKAAQAQRELAEQLQLKLDRALVDAQEKSEELDELYRQRERERAAAEAAKPPSPPQRSTPDPSTPMAASATGGAAVYSGQAEGLSPGLHGAGWLVEVRDRQARAEALEAKMDHFKGRCVAQSLDRLRGRTLLAVWRAWGALVLTTRRRQGERLSRMAGSIVAAAASGTAPSALLLADHNEWWERGHKKAPPVRSPPVDRRTMV